MCELTPLHVTATPSEVSTAPGLPRVIVSEGLSTSDALIVPVAVVLFVVSVGLPTLSGLPPGRPSSDTVAELPVTVGASLVPLMVTVMIWLAVPPGWPSATCTV